MRAFRTLPAPKMGPSPFCTLYPYAIANSAGITVPLSPPNPIWLPTQSTLPQSPTPSLSILSSRDPWNLPRARHNCLPMSTRVSQPSFCVLYQGHARFATSSPRYRFSSNLRIPPLAHVLSLLVRQTIGQELARHDRIPMSTPHKHWSPCDLSSISTVYYHVKLKNFLRVSHYWLYS